MVNNDNETALVFNAYGMVLWQTGAQLVLGAVEKPQEGRPLGGYYAELVFPDAEDGTPGITYRKYGSDLHTATWQLMRYLLTQIPVESAQADTEAKPED